MGRLINDGWSFFKAQSGSALKEALCGNWRQVDIPHDWLIEQANDLYETSDGWYKCTLRFDDTEGVYRYIRFDGVYMDCEIYVNGSVACVHKYGYTAFDCPLTPFIYKGDNELIVHVRYQSPNSRWYSGAGIFRDVTLNEYGPTHIAPDGVYAHVEADGDDYAVTLATEIVVEAESADSESIAAVSQATNAAEATAPAGAAKPAQPFGQLMLRHEILNADGDTVARAETMVDRAGEHTLQLKVAKPALWSVDEPNLYTLVTTLGSETITQRLGFRTIRITTDEGMYLNGKPLKLHGICNHHDLGALGAAFNLSAARRQLACMKDMGVNSLRTSHNPPAKRLMELCDEMGFLVIDEAFDMWERPKTEYDYARFFGECSAGDVRSWVRRDRNHACLLMWSIGNEIYDTHADAKRGLQITEYLRDEVLKNDPMLNAPVTVGSNYMAWENAQRCADAYKLAGYNYGEKYYAEHHRAHPDWTIYGSETMSVLTSRGVYHFPKSENILCEDDMQCSSLGNSMTSWGARSFEIALADDMNCRYSLGQFIWSGVDYIGEPTPYKTRSCYFGQVDTACFPKDQYYLFRSYWRDAKDAPTLHIGMCWDFNDGQMIDIPVYSNLPKAELFLNGRSLGAQEIKLADAQRAYGLWRAPYERGELRAVGYDAAGNKALEDVRRSFGDVKRLSVYSENPDGLQADGESIAYIVISAKDGEGNPVMNANNRVTVSVSGEGRLIGMDNGDSDDTDEYKTDSRRLFSGMLLAMIGTTKRAGDINITVSSRGMPDEHITLTTVRAEAREGASACEYRCPSAPVNDEIPVRKLELTARSSRALDKLNRTCELSARLLPEDATYRNIEWRAATASGVQSNSVTLEAHGDNAIVTAVGDGLVYLRATCDNGYDHPKIISMLELQATGLGKPSIDPYQLVSAGLFDISYGSVTAGNERGVATARDGECMFGFTNLDFGAIGSSEITIPIFALNDDEYRFDIWLGDPRDASSERLGTYSYQKLSIWNTYQSETYVLPRRLKGLCTLAFVMSEKVHVKGFVFAKPQKAYERLSALDCDSLYGDCYRRGDRGVMGIGNNVTLVYRDMDFGAAGMATLRLNGGTPLDVNTVQIRIISDAGDETTQIAEYRGDGDGEQLFPLALPEGNCELSFVFLPGSSFDFYDFKIERQ